MESSSISNLGSCGSTTTSCKEKGKKKEGGGAVKLSTDPQSVAARLRRHRISDRFKILQSLVPGGSKMDTVSMLEQAIQYVKFLKNQIWLHQAMIDFVDPPTSISQPSNCAAHPFNNPEFELFEVDRVLADFEQVCLPESWFYGGENWVFDASMQS